MWVLVVVLLSCNMSFYWDFSWATWTWALVQPFEITRYACCCLIQLVVLYAGCLFVMPCPYVYDILVQHWPVLVRNTLWVVVSTLLALCVVIESSCSMWLVHKQVKSWLFGCRLTVCKRCAEMSQATEGEVDVVHGKEFKKLGSEEHLQVCCIYFDAWNTKSELMPHFIYFFCCNVCKSCVGSIVQIDRQKRYVFPSSQVHLPSRKVAWLDKNESTSLRAPPSLCLLAYRQAGRQAGWNGWCWWWCLMRWYSYLCNDDTVPVTWQWLHKATKSSVGGLDVSIYQERGISFF
jgi:hypothetical protein